MRVFAFVGAVLVTTALFVGTTVVLVLTYPELDGWLFLASISLVLLVFPPVVLGSLRAYGDDQRSAEARIVLRRWQIVIACAEVVGAIGLVAWSAGTASPLWIPLLFIGIGVVFLVVAVVIGGVLGRDETKRMGRSPSTRQADGAAITSAEVRRKIIVVVVTFALTAAVVGIGTSVIFSSLDGPPLFALLSGLQFGFIASALAAVIVVLPWNRALRDSTGRDLGRARALAKVVLRGKSLPLAPGDENAAARYAAIASVSLPFQLAYLVLLYAGLILGQVPNLLEGDRSWFPVAIFGMLAVALVVLLPWLALQIGRARRYARAHPVVLSPEGAPAA